MNVKETVIKEFSYQHLDFKYPLSSILIEHVRYIESVCMSFCEFSLDCWHELLFWLPTSAGRKLSAFVKSQERKQNTK